MANQKDHPDRPATQPHPVGPTSIDGLEASELPDKGRGAPETSPGKELSRKVPHQTGGVIGGDVGLAATPDAADARDHGPRGKN